MIKMLDQISQVAPKFKQTFSTSWNETDQFVIA